jgi:Flp pilus assembly pilin Flp
MFNLLKELKTISYYMKGTKGQGMVEYGLVLAGVVTVVIAAVAVLSGDGGITSIFTDLLSDVAGEANPVE